MLWKRISAVLLVVVGSVLVAMVIVGDAARSSRSDTGRFEERLETLQNVNAEVRTRTRLLDRTLRSLRTKPALLEQEAREDLGFIRDGEVVVILPK